MKIYHPKNFLAGALLLLLGISVIAVGVWKGFNLYLVALALLLLAVGGRILFRSLSRTRARRDRIQQQDERNQLVLLKARSAAFRITQVTCAITGLIALAAWWFLRGSEAGLLCFAFCAGLGAALAVLRAALLVGFLIGENST